MNQSAFETKAATGVKSIAQMREELKRIRDARSQAEWPVPELVRHEKLPVLPLTEDMLPEPFRKWLADISDRMQCPLDFVASAAIAMTSIIIGTGCGIRPKRLDDWLVVVNLWGALIARPGMLKTPAQTEAMKPLARMQARSKQEYDDAMKTYEAEAEMFEAEKKALKSKMTALAVAKKKGAESAGDLKQQYTTLQPPTPPVWKRYITNDPTVEKLAMLLAENPRGLLVLRDEITGLLHSWDKQGHESDRAFYLEAWNGDQSHVSDRILRGSTVTQSLCATVFGGIQPSKLESYLYKTVRNIENDGLIQRLQLLVYPDEPKCFQLIDRHPDHVEKNRAFAVIERLATIEFESHGATLDEGERIPYLRFKPDAQEFFYTWLAELERRLRSNDEEPIMCEHLGKYRSLMPSLALIFHLIEVADDKLTGDVTLHSAERAAKWCNYLESHARRVYGLVGNVSVQAASRLARKIEEGALEDGFTARDIYRKQWSLLDDKDVAEAALAELTECGWIRQESQHSTAQQGGRPPGPVFRINPKIKRATATADEPTRLEDT